jgi:hypothetical protein
MLLAAADAEDAPSRRAILADATAATQAAAAPLNVARAAWHTFFGGQGDARAAEIVSADGLAALQNNAVVSRDPDGVPTYSTDGSETIECTGHEALESIRYRECASRKRG